MLFSSRKEPTPLWVPVRRSGAPHFGLCPALRHGSCCESPTNLHPRTRYRESVEDLVIGRTRDRRDQRHTCQMNSDKRCVRRRQPVHSVEMRSSAASGSALARGPAMRTGRRRVAVIDILLLVIRKVSYSALAVGPQFGGTVFSAFVDSCRVSHGEPVSWALG
jgi:hypothetical protein